MTDVDEADKAKLVESLTSIESDLKKLWDGQDSFIDLQERILTLKMILEKIGDAAAAKGHKQRSSSLLFVLTFTLFCTKNIYFLKIFWSASVNLAKSFTFFTNISNETITRL